MGSIFRNKEHSVKSSPYCVP